MQHRRAPESFSRKAMVAFNLAVLPCVVTAVLLLAFQPTWPIWDYSLIFGISFVLFLVLLARFMPRFHCPECGRTLGREHRRGFDDGDRTCFCCPDCQIEWEAERCLKQESKTPDRTEQ